MSKCVAKDSSPEARQEIDPPFALDLRLVYPSHVPAFRSTLRPDRPSDCALLRINSGH